MAPPSAPAPPLHCLRLLLLAASLCALRAQPNASCATNSTPCPPPRWAPSYNMARSAMVNPNGPTPFAPNASQPWGLVSLDWNVGSTVWNASGPHAGTIEATTRANCAAIKAMHPATRCFGYHNMELSLEAIESQRSAMFPGEPNYNPAYFLRFPNGTIYNEPGGPGAQFFWNFTNPATRAFFVSSIMSVLAHPELDGTYTDDVSGLPSEHFAMVRALGLTPAQIAAHQHATSLAGAALIDAAVAAGKYVWQAFDGNDLVGRDGSLPGPTPATCLAWMRARCAPAYLAHAVLQQALPNGAVFTPAQMNASLASFLVTRGAACFWGFGWDGKPRDGENWLPEFLWDVGEPVGQCVEASAGVFTRAWSYGEARLDCNSFVGTVPAR